MITPRSAAAPRPDTHNNFDLLRLLAAMQVAYFHAVFHLRVPVGEVVQGIHKVLDFFPGVPIFFVISGFLISKSYERSRSFGSYARNRFLRVYPGLWVAFAALVVLLGAHRVLDAAAVTRAPFLAWIAAQLTVGQFFNPDMVRGFGVGTPNGSLWTIPVEIGFYLLVPILYVAIRRLRAAAADLFLAAVALASYALWLAIVTRPGYEERLALKLVLVTAIPHLHLFLLGVLAHRNFDRLRPLLEGKALAWTAGYIAVMLGLDAWLGPGRKTHVLAALLANVLLAGFTLSVAFTRRSLSERVLRGNDLSYGLYIYHMLVVNTFVQHRATGQAWQVAAAIGISLAVAVLSWRLVESPALRLKTVRRAPAASATATG
jgi:peptidoglycan/LPS O-acetylase OafA/YrhL